MGLWVRRMFEPRAKPRGFGIPPGADFAKAVSDGLKSAYASRPPEELGDVHIFANAGRMGRRLVECFTDGAPRLLPRIALVSDVFPLVPEAPIEAALSPLERTLEMARLIAPLLASPEAPAPQSSLFDLADSLVALLDEMHTEGVALDAVLDLDVTAGPRHWAQLKQFLGIVGAYLDATHATGRDPAARQRLATKYLIERWERDPPKTPVLIVGSTGSRGTTFELMQAVAKLPQGAVVLPGFDDHMPGPVWTRLQNDTPPQEDHPQYRYAKFLETCGLDPRDVIVWPAVSPDPARNALISLSLRPAPVTDQWRQDSADHGDLVPVTHNMTMIAAPDPTSEAGAIAVAMRQAIEDGKRVALITPDRTLSRRVTAALLRWSITPDDSAGMPLSLSPPGRLLRQVAAMMRHAVSPGDLVALLRHPLVRTGGDDRGEHTLWTNALDLALREDGAPHVSGDFVTKQGENDDLKAAWCAWVSRITVELEMPSEAPLATFARRQCEISEMLSGGGGVGSGELWEKEAGEAARSVMDRFSGIADSNGTFLQADYTRLFDAALNAENVRATEASRPDVVILGTLEARVANADVVILGGLNEGIWPPAPTPDPWLSRGMREATGLLSPERQVGLSAHDFQQAIGAETVILSRARRNEDAEPVPSRWVSRLTNLLEGVEPQNGPEALRRMVSKGDRFLAAAAALDAPGNDTPPAPRPAPAPPSHLRPKTLSVTTVEKLIRDPYWIYARHVLRLRPLPDLTPQPNAALRGQVFHKIMELFVNELRETGMRAEQHRFLEIADATLEALVPWLATRRLWKGHLTEVSEHLVGAEHVRSGWSQNIATEVKGRLELSGTDFVITGEADRIDKIEVGRLFIYDYKSGSIPTAKQIKQFNPQILIEGLMAEHGAFDGVSPAPADRAAYISLGRSGSATEIELADNVITKTRPEERADFGMSTIAAELETLLTAYAQESRGYASRRAMERMRFEGDFDHLARFGEWDETATPEVIPLK